MKIFLKLTLASAILFWLVKSDKLNFDLLFEVIKYPELIFISTFFCMTQVCLTSYRWGIMLKMKSPELSKRKIFATQWIGQLFSAVLPGAVTGDLIKIGHLAGNDKTISKKYLLFTIFLDRVLGLSALLTISCVSGLLLYKELIGLNVIFKEIIVINILLLLATFAFLSLFFLNIAQQNLVLRFVKIKKIQMYLLSLWELGQYKKKFFHMFILSILAHTCAILSLYFINKNFFNPDFHFKYLFAIVPMGQISVAIPISPGGLGIGHLVFDKLFFFIHQENGASFFNLAWIAALMTNLLGIFPYFFSKTDSAISNKKRAIAISRDGPFLD
jgi:hypothetical protein